MIHWISNSRVSLQRLGFCKVALCMSEGCRSRGDLSLAVRQRIQESVPIDATSDLAKWVRSRPKGSLADAANGKTAVALQDQWAYEHPARTGWLLDLAREEYFESMGLPFLLGLLDDECHRTDLGALLLVLNREASTTWVPGRQGNPLILSTGDRVIFLYSLIKADGDFLIPYLNDLRRFGDGSFSYLEAGERVPEVIDGILKTMSGAVYTSADRERIRDLESARAKIEQNIGSRAETMGSGSRREQTVLPRLEWLADLGVLIKGGDKARSHTLSPSGMKFIEMLHSKYVAFVEEGYAEEAVGKVLDRCFFGLAHLLLYGVADMQSVPSVLDFVAPAYSELRSPTGYCVGRPLLLLSHVRSWEAGGRLALEYDDAKMRIEAEYQRAPSRFYFTTARFGEDFQIKLEMSSH